MSLAPCFSIVQPLQRTPLLGASLRYNASPASRLHSRVGRLSISPRRLRANLDDGVSPTVDTPLNAPVVDQQAPSPQTATEQSSAQSSFQWLNQWYPVAWESDLKPGTIFKFTVFDQPYILFRDEANGQYVAMDDLCPHRAVPLSQGRLFNRVLEDGQKQTVLECRYHGWRFGCDGACLNIPIKDGQPSKAANVRGVYRCDALTFGSHTLLFVWLGDQSRATTLQSTIVPKWFEDQKPIMFFRRFMRFFPFGYDSVMENIADPAHVPFSHHRTEGLRQRVKAGEYCVEVDEEDVQTGHFKGNYSSYLGKLDMNLNPTSVQYGAIPDRTTGENRLNIIVWVVPTSRDMHCLFAIRGFRNPPAVFAWKQAVLPEWMDHGLSNAVLDGDAVFLQWQNVDLIERQLRTGKPGWQSRYLLSETKADEMVVTWRKWFHSVSHLMPYTSPPHTTAPRRLSDREVNDRARFHTMYCAVCSAALRNARLVALVCKIVIPLALFAAAAAAAVAVSALQPGVVASGSLATYAWACVALAVVAGVALVLAGRVIRTTTYSDTAYVRAMADDTQF